MIHLTNIFLVVRPSIAATAVSQCLYYIGGDDDAMEKVCNMPQPLLNKVLHFFLSNLKGPFCPEIFE